MEHILQKIAEDETTNVSEMRYDVEFKVGNYLLFITLDNPYLKDRLLGDCPGVPYDIEHYVKGMEIANKFQWVGVRDVREIIS